MSKNDIHIRPANEGDLEGLRKLYLEVFAHSRPVEHDKWKYFQNYAGNLIASVAENQFGAIVAQYALLPTYLRLGDEVVLGAQSLDTMTHPDYRGRGLFIMLANECFQLAHSAGVEALYGFPNENSYPGFIRRLNWNHCGDVPAWIRPLSGFKYKRLPPMYSKIVGNLLVKLLPTGAGAHKQFSVVRGRPANAAIENLLSEQRVASTGCCVDRTIKWYDWRFCELLGRNYQWISAYDGERLRGVCIWGQKFESPGVGIIAELLGTNPVALTACLLTAMGDASSSNIHVLNVITNDPVYSVALKACGFIKRSKVALIVRPMTWRPLGSNMHCMPNWRIISSDADTY